MVMNEKPDCVARLAQFLQYIRDCRWRDVLGFRQWNASADTMVAFAFRCDKGRMGIVTVFSPADSQSPDEPQHFTILSVEEGKKLLAVVEARKVDASPPDASFPTLIPRSFRSNPMAFFYCCLEENGTVGFRRAWCYPGGCCSGTSG